MNYGFLINTHKRIHTYAETKASIINSTTLSFEKMSFIGFSPLDFTRILQEQKYCGKARYPEYATEV